MARPWSRCLVKGPAQGTKPCLPRLAPRTGCNSWYGRTTTRTPTPYDSASEGSWSPHLFVVWCCWGNKMWKEVPKTPPKSKVVKRHWPSCSYPISNTCGPFSPSNGPPSRPCPNPVSRGPQIAFLSCRPMTWLLVGHRSRHWRLASWTSWSRRDSL